MYTHELLIGKPSDNGVPNYIITISLYDHRLEGVEHVSTGEVSSKTLEAGTAPGRMDNPEVDSLLSKRVEVKYSLPSDLEHRLCDAVVNLLGAGWDARYLGGSIENDGPVVHKTNC